MDVSAFMHSYSDYLFFGVFALAILGIICQQILFARIRKYHSLKWVELGEPGLWNMTQRNNWRFMRLLFKSDPQLSGDMRVNGLIDLNRILAIITILSVICLFAFNVLSAMSMVQSERTQQEAPLLSNPND